MDKNSVLSIFNGENRLLLLVVFCFFVCFFCCCVFFSENLKLLFLQLGAGEEMEGIFHLALFCLFCQCLCYLENIFCFSQREDN